MTTTLGAEVGFALLWWILLACWVKSIVQALLARFTIATGEPALHAFNRLPGKLPGPGGKKVSWYLYLWFFDEIMAHLVNGGLYGGAALALHMAMPVVPAWLWAIMVAASVAVLVYTGTYRILEKLLFVMVATFTFVTLFCAISLQFTEYAMTLPEFQSGLTFELPAVAMATAVAAYAATGVGWAEQV
jgi:Mn2+/Fe2+ NRAMP family transporter